MLNYLLELSHRDDSNKWSNIGFGEEIRQVVLIEVDFPHLIWSSAGSFARNDKLINNCQYILLYSANLVNIIG